MKFLFQPMPKLTITINLLVAVTQFHISTANAQQNKVNHEGIYQVEMIVFARNNDSGQEHWPSNIKLRYPGDWVELKDPNSTLSESEASSSVPNEIDLTTESFYLLPANERQLNTQAQKLQRNPSFEVLFHSAWRQPITNKKASKAIIINGGRTFGQHQELEGSIRLSVATYLELQTNLWLARYDINVGQEMPRQWPDVPLRPNFSANTLTPLSLDGQLELDQNSAIENIQWPTTNLGTNPALTEEDTFLTREIILLQQERDMRSGELHYLDHPVLNILIQITPYIPAATTPE
jgi:hypothetical protein